MPSKQDLQQLLEQLPDDALLEKFLQELRQLASGDKKTDVFSELKAAKAELEQYKALQEKFFSIVSYELGSPLNSLASIAGFLMMDAEQSGNEQLTDSVRFLVEQTTKLQKQMGNLIEWASFEVKNYSFKPAPLDVAQLLHQCVESFRSQAENKGISLHIAAPQAVEVSADRRMIQQLLHNLLSNAVKFSRKGDRIEAGVVPGNGSASIFIHDTGIGMGKAKMENLFNPARKNTQRGTANEAGLGLGMITSKAILDLHQSRLMMQSEQGKGTQLSFELALLP